MAMGLGEPIFSLPRQATRPLLATDGAVSSETRSDSLFDVAMFEAPHRVEFPAVRSGESVPWESEAIEKFNSQNGVRLLKYVLFWFRLVVFVGCFGTLHRGRIHPGGKVLPCRNQCARTSLTNLPSLTSSSWTLMRSKSICFRAYRSRLSIPRDP